MHNATRAPASYKTAVMLVASFLLLLAAPPVDAADDLEWTELTVSPAPEPQPALRYQLLPRRTELRHGDAAPIYFRATLLLASNPDWQGRARLVADWQRLPLDELPVDDVRRMVEGIDLWMVDRAAMHDRATWESGYERDGVSTLLPELSQMRSLGRMVALRSRLHILDGDHAAAIDSLRTGFAMAYHTAEEPVLISRLVGISVAASMIEAARDLIASPGSPNLYWALAELEHRPFDNAGAIRVERDVIYATVAALRDVPDVPMTTQQAERLWETVRHEGRYMFDGTWPPPGLDLLAAMSDYEPGKEALIEAGLDREAVEAMPVRQVLIKHWLAEYEHWADELTKWSLLPYEESWQGGQRFEDLLHQHMRSRAFAPLLQTLAGFEAARGTEQRLRRRLALLRCLEAIRMHAAAHEGQLPASLDDISIAPVPHDPATGLPFDYTLEDDGRTFRLLPQEPDDQRMRVRVKEDRLRVRLADETQ